MEHEGDRWLSFQASGEVMSTKINYKQQLVIGTVQCYLQALISHVDIHCNRNIPSTFNLG